MLQATSENLSMWKKMAFDICKDEYLSDDLVSEMYLKLSAYNKPLNNHYIFFTIKHLYINWIREEKKANALEISDNIANISEDDYLEPDKAIKIPPCLTWVERQILTLRQTYSGRDIEKKYRINYQKVHRIEKEAKRKAREWILKEQETLSQQ